MKNLTFTIMALTAMVGIVQANDMSPTTSNMPAVATSSSTNPSAPVAGRNSFTESQVRDRLAKAGYSHITGLAKGEDGIWRANAKKGQMRHEVTLDYQGNITTAK